MVIFDNADAFFPSWGAKGMTDRRMTTVCRRSLSWIVLVLVRNMIRSSFGRASYRS